MELQITFKKKQGIIFIFRTFFLKIRIQNKTINPQI